MSAADRVVSGLIVHLDADAAEAHWLRRRLHNFTPPRGLGDGKTRLGRFSVLSEGAGATPAAAQSIADADWLIVCCQPATGASNWIEAQIDAFAAARGSEKMRGVLLYGDPVTAFPRALRSDKYFAADFRDGADGREIGVVKLMATMLSAPHGAMTDALAARERSRQRLGLIAAGVAALCALAAAIAAPLALQRIAEADNATNQAVAAGADLLAGASAIAQRAPGAEADLRTLVAALEEGLDPVFATRTDARTARQRAGLLIQIAEIYGRLGDSELQREHAEAASALLATLPADDRRSIDYVRTLAVLAQSDFANGRTEEGVARLQESIDAARQLGDAPEVQQALAANLQRLGLVQLAAERPSNAAPPLLEAAALLEQRVAAAPEVDALHGELVIVRRALGEAQRAAGDAVSARRTLQSAVADTRAWLALAEPNERPARQAVLGAALQTLGQFLAEAGDARNARAPLEESLAIARSLAAANPQDETLQGDVALRLVLTANVLLDLRQAATPMLEEAIATGRSLVARNPRNASLKSMLAEMLAAQAARASANGEREDARALWQEVAALRASLAELQPREGQPLRDLIAAHTRIAQISVQLNDPAGRIRALGGVVGARRGLVALTPDDAAAKRALAASLHDLGVARAGNNNPRGAIRALGEAADIRLALAGEAPSGAFALQAAADLAQMPLAQESATARPVLERARATMARLVSDHPNDRRFAEALARTEQLIQGGGAGPL